MSRCFEFHLHLENVRARPPHLQVTKEVWDAAAARHPDLAQQIRVTLGWDGDILDDMLETADFTINSYPPKDRLAHRAPRLKWIQTTGAGIETLLPLDWLPPGVTLTNNRGAHGEKAEDSCTLALLAIHTRFMETLRQQHDRVWKQILTPTIAGRTAVVVGFGDLGQGAGRAARKLGLRVIAVTRSGKPCSLADGTYRAADMDRVLPAADFLIVTTPLTPETRGLVDRRRIGLLKDDCGVVNIGRSAVMDYEALRERLDSGHLAGAVLDVFDEEPLPPESPWWTTRNVIVTPHISCDTPGYMDRLLDRWFENFSRFLAGKPLENIVDRRLGY